MLSCVLFDTVGELCKPEAACQVGATEAEEYCGVLSPKVSVTGDTMPESRVSHWSTVYHVQNLLL